MTGRKQPLISLILLGLIAASGCHPTQPFFYHEDGDLSHYLDRVTQLETPDLEMMPLVEVTETLPPLTVLNSVFNDFWNLKKRVLLRRGFFTGRPLRDHVRYITRAMSPFRSRKVGGPA